MWTTNEGPPLGLWHVLRGREVGETREKREGEGEGEGEGGRWEAGGGSDDEEGGMAGQKRRERKGGGRNETKKERDEGRWEWQQSKKPLKANVSIK